MQGRSQVFIGGGQLGPYKFVKKFSAKIDKTLNFKLIFNYVAIIKFLIFKIFLFNTKINLYWLKNFEKKQIEDKFRKNCVNMAKPLSDFREN